MPPKLKTGFITVSKHGVFGSVIAYGSLVVFLYTIYLVLYRLNLSSSALDGQHSLSFLTSLCEIGIGVNLALSLVDQLTKFVVSHYTLHVRQYGINNATFADVMTQVLSPDVLNSKGVALVVDKEEFIDRFTACITKELAEFQGACEALTQYAKCLGFVVALTFFSVLGTVSIFPNANIELLAAKLMCVLAATPLAVHLLGTAGFAELLVWDIKRFNDKNDEHGMFNKLARKIIKSYHEKVETLTEPDVVKKWGG
jgi:hypothetical protein